MEQGRLADLQGQLIEVTQLHLTRAEDRTELLLTVELNQKTYSLRFLGVHSLSIDSFSYPFQIGGFLIEDNHERGWECAQRYTVSDFEEGRIGFYCEEIELLDVRTRSESSINA